jgi:uncharacterized damage-inducible protein DinB
MNAACLDQSLSLLDRIDAAAYVRTQPPVFASGVGSHLRHALDYYEGLFTGMKSGRIDYEARSRDPRLEQDPRYAAAKIKEVQATLLKIPAEAEDRELFVLVENGSSASPGATTTIRRELDMLLGHTVHHYALISVALKLQGIDPGEEFGVAPSTLRYLKSAAPLTG